MRMRQSPAQLEQAFAEEAKLDRQRREHLHLKTLKRSSSRRLERQHRHGAMRFLALVLVILATSVIVTLAMFEALIMVMG